MGSKIARADHMSLVCWSHGSGVLVTWVKCAGHMGEVCEPERKEQHAAEYIDLSCSYFMSGSQILLKRIQCYLDQ